MFIETAPYYQHRLQNYTPEDLFYELLERGGEFLPGNGFYTKTKYLELEINGKEKTACAIIPFKAPTVADVEIIACNLAALITLLTNEDQEVLAQREFHYSVSPKGSNKQVDKPVFDVHCDLQTKTDGSKREVIVTETTNSGYFPCLQCYSALLHSPEFIQALP